MPVLASQIPGGATADAVIPEWREEVTAEYWTVTCIVVGALTLHRVILDAIYGVLDSTTRLAV